MKKTLRGALSWAVAPALALAVVATTGLVVGHVRQSQDVAWCNKVTPSTLTVKGVKEPVDPTVLKEARSGCVAQRRDQRGIFGAVWRTGGRETAVCAVDWGRYQQLFGSDQAAASAVMKHFGITDTLDAGSKSDQQRFITACLKAKHIT
ncbi:MAG: hypothetical protein QOF96_2 [Actinomycetota bacterium]|nr:hypothetical protein [Actinomycetota bacterium]